MSGPPNEETAPRPAGIVERLVRDDVDRKRFLKMAGSAGAASFGAFVMAACGSSSSSKTAATTAASHEHLEQLGQRRWATSRSSTTR